MFSSSKISLKKIIVSAQYREQDFDALATSYCVFNDYLIEQNLLPLQASFHTGFQSKLEAEKIAEEYIQIADYLVLSGGSDICPSLYNQANYYSKGIVRFRDFFELSLLDFALKKHIPILGICRGMQLINSYFGGQCYQDLDHNSDNTKFQKHYFGSSSDYSSHGKIGNSKHHHTVNLVNNGILAEVLGVDTLWVNSFHHQGISVLAKNLLVEASSQDGLVEAFSDVKNQILAVQWHPELDPQRIEYKTILNHFFQKKLL